MTTTSSATPAQLAVRVTHLTHSGRTFPQLAAALTLAVVGCGPLPAPAAAVSPDVGRSTDLAPVAGDIDHAPDVTRQVQPDLLQTAQPDLLSAPSPDLLQPADLEPAADLTPAPTPDLLQLPDLTPPATPDLVNTNCGKFGLDCCAGYTCGAGLRCYVTGDTCGAQPAVGCGVDSGGCGGQNTPCCDAGGQIKGAWGYCRVGLWCSPSTGRCQGCRS